MPIVFVVAGVCVLWLAVQLGILGLDETDFGELPLSGLLIALGVLLLVWLWTRRAKWH